MNRKSLFIVTTVPITLKGILTGQPKHLNDDYDVSIVSSPDKELYEVSNIETVTAYNVSMERGISPFKDVVSIFKMYKLLRKYKPDVVHSYTPKAGLVTMLAGFLARIPIRIHTFTGLIFPTSSSLKKQILIWMDRLICACATHVVPEGEGVKQDLYSFRVTNKPLNVIGHGNIAGVDTTYFRKDAVANKADTFRQSLELPDDAFVFCFVGRFTEDKGFYELLEAFKKLPENAFLLLVGIEDERLPLPKDISVELTSHPRVQKTGWVNDVRPALAVSDVLVLPSYREGFPNTPLQAGSMGIPSIVTDINGSNEIIQHGYNGWVVPPKDSDSLFEAMHSAMDLSELNDMSGNARKNIKQKFEKSAYLEYLTQFYRDTIN